ncbi:MAG: methyltransferase domain-containing protein [Cyanobacteriota bacterium]|nr:methyltransferase domain-containing protein [Cyanobacteriota bacterium]
MSLKLSPYKQQIADLYSRRSPTYDQSQWHHKIARRLVECAQIQPGQTVLDLATGTAMAAIAAAKIVGDGGRVIGVDISAGMLERAAKSIQALGIENIQLHLADAETFVLPDKSCDRILCSSALIWMSDLTAALRQWHRFLKPGGLLAFHAFAETSFVGSLAAQKVAEEYGISLWMNKPTGTVEKCYNLLASAGYEAIQIEPEQYGSYISVDEAKQMWMGFDSPTPGQFPNPFARLSPQQLERARVELEAELKARASDRGVWNDITVFFVVGRKS